MNEVTRLLDQAQQGDPKASEQLMPLIYDALRKLANRQMAGEKADHTLEPTALVHEAYLRLVGDRHYESRGHFYLVASRVMRQILIDNARRRKSEKRGGKLARKELDLHLVAAKDDDFELLALDEVLAQLAQKYPRHAQLIELRFFGGMAIEEAAETLGISLSTAVRDWRFAKAWIYDAFKKSGDEEVT
jgi:RNA polymerase sigma factor (TIGR02999 family)